MSDSSKVLDAKIHSVATDAENADTENDKDNDINEDNITVITENKEKSLRSTNGDHDLLLREDLEIADSKLGHDTDSIMNNGIIDDDKYGNKNNGLEDDSSDYSSSDEDTAVEYMPDGEIVRKKSRGFKQLSNCKRFWKASLMTT